MIGHEMELFNVTLWLAPGMNIHRNPLCGRNFEYYSEDPLLAGMMAAAMTLGVQKVPGCGTTIKHFACNNQEDNRMGSDSILSERALREIYLKGFEIAVKDAQPMSIMTSYNLINGVHAANCYDTCTKAARDEWGFAGAIMTDWTTTNVQIQGECTAAGCMRAGNDMVMPGLPEDHENIKKELADGTLTMAELKRCIYNTVNIVLQSNMYEGAVSYLDQFDDLDTYLTVK
jgi:beta-glucosidase